MNGIVAVPVAPPTQGPSRAVPRPSVTKTALTDDECVLLERLRQGDEAAFDSLVTQHHGALVRMARSFVADRDVAEEVVQDTWMTVIQTLDRFEGRSSLRSWMFGIVIHKAKDRGVREKRHTTFSALAPIDGESEETVDPACFYRSGEGTGHWVLPPQPWDDHTPEKLLASKQAIAALRRAIDELPPTLKTVLILRDVEGVESADACDMLKISETNLYVRLHRARERVRQAVDTYWAGGAGGL